MAELSPIVGRRQYLVTYSQANLELFPTRESFGRAVAEEFDEGSGKVKVDYWACCKESHSDGGFHYHCSVKLTGSKKWIGVKNRISQKHKIQVNFSDKHDFYLSSYRYVCKSDTSVYHSDNHPTGLLSANSPVTKKGVQVFKANAQKRRSLNYINDSSLTKAKRPKRLSNLDVSEQIKRENVKTYTQLLALAETRREAGQTDLANFVFSRSGKSLEELVTKTWSMDSARADLEKRKLSRMDILDVYKQDLCTEPCGGAWLECAKEILYLNHIDVPAFASSLRSLLKQGRGKHRNLLITGSANCGKTFMLKPLQVIYKGEIFENPANDKYGWVGADKARVIFLNDFRWTKELITWKDLLLLLEGEPVKLPAPKNNYAEDVHITSDLPIFATSKTSIRYRGSYGATDEVEDKMMEVRWKVYKFNHPFEEGVQKHLAPCAKCFCNLVYTV